MDFEKEHKKRLKIQVLSQANNFHKETDMEMEELKINLSETDLVLLTLGESLHMKRNKHTSI